MSEKTDRTWKTAQLPGTYLDVIGQEPPKKIIELPVKKGLNTDDIIYWLNRAQEIWPNHQINPLFKDIERHQENGCKNVENRYHKI